MIINLNNAFPLAEDGTRGPLPKQKLFLECALKERNPKYVRYVGGIGSGKSLILSTTMLTLGLMYPGDYLIARQNMPELRDTTMKTFLEVIHAVGKDIMIEHRVADAVVRVKSRGGVATFLFRGLEEPDKLRSLNLNAFGIDEANQVSEAAFLLLQGRLRGKFIRKGFLAQNSGGHDWTWRYFVKKDMMRSEREKDNYVNIKAPSTENVHLPEGYVESILNTWSEERIKREIYADEDSFEGQVYSEFRSDIHVVRPFAIPEEWTRIIGADHGFRNPACWLWGAVDYDGNIYIYREFYKKEWIIEDICRGRTKPQPEPGVIELMRRPGADPKDKSENAYERIDVAVIDPAVRARSGRDGKSDYDLYVENLPEWFNLNLANNEKTAGIDRVKSYLKVDARTGKPRMFIFSTCVNTIEEAQQYRYDSLPTSQEGKRNLKEEPRKVNDHAMDAWRYLVMTQPELPVEHYEKFKDIKPGTTHWNLAQEIQNTLHPKPKDPYSDL